MEDDTSGVIDSVQDFLISIHILHVEDDERYAAKLRELGHISIHILHVEDDIKQCIFLTVLGISIHILHVEDD